MTPAQLLAALRALRDRQTALYTVAVCGSPAWIAEDAMRATAPALAVLDEAEPEDRSGNWRRVVPDEAPAPTEGAPDGADEYPEPVRSYYEAVEVVAKAALSASGSGYRWDELEDRERSIYRHQARAMIQAYEAWKAGRR